jgi:hypothetical protein
MDVSVYEDEPLMAYEFGVTCNRCGNLVPLTGMMISADGYTCPPGDVKGGFCVPVAQ